MVDIDAAIGYVVARGDAVDRARLSWLRAAILPPEDVLEQVESGQLPTGGWPAQDGDVVASVDATCYRLAELDDLGALGRPAASHALDWLANRQRRDGYWEEDHSLAESAPPWAQPGDPEARFFLTATAAYWLAVAARDFSPVSYATSDAYAPAESGLYAVPLSRAAEALRGSLGEDGSWPGYLASGWYSGAVMQRTDWYYEAARIFMILGERVKSMAAADAASMSGALRRIGVSEDDSIQVAARQRLDETQRPDGAWPSGAEGVAFDVQTTLAGIRALR